MKASPVKTKRKRRVAVVQIPPAKWSHDWWVQGMETVELERIVSAFGKKNLRDYSDDETRWCALRLSAARRELKTRSRITS
jgi:hypothetical protein